ncbi:MAG: hypothetical protein GKS06_20425 [Acidobacteria bacterium]|nr:hypothetical protein [Acidobacteriota bacterium]
MRNVRRIPVACLLILLVLVSGTAAAQEEDGGNTYDIFIEPEGLFTGKTVTIETDMRLGTENRGAERRIKNEIERLLKEWGRYEVVDDLEDADIKITLVTNDQVNFSKGIYEQVMPLAEFNKLLFVVADPADQALMWADGTTDSLTGRRVSGNQRRGWDNEGARRIANHFVLALRERIDREL